MRHRAVFMNAAAQPDLPAHLSLVTRCKFFVVLMMICPCYLLSGIEETVSDAVLVLILCRYEYVGNINLLYQVPLFVVGKSI